MTSTKIDIESALYTRGALSENAELVVCYAGTNLPVFGTPRVQADSTGRFPDIWLPAK